MRFTGRLFRWRSIAATELGFFRRLQVSFTPGAPGFKSRISLSEAVVMPIRVQCRDEHRDGAP